MECRGRQGEGERRDVQASFYGSLVGAYRYFYEEMNLQLTVISGAHIKTSIQSSTKRSIFSCGKVGGYVCVCVCDRILRRIQ